MCAKRLPVLVAVLCLAWAGWSQQKPVAPAAPFNLRCEYLVAPMGVDVAQPRLSWVLDHPERGQVQSAYQVLVSLQPGAPAGDQWDSGRVASAQSTHVVYGGKPLAGGRAYYWKTRWWDKNGAASPWSAVARFDTGLLAASDWKGQFIGGANQLRKEFTLERVPARASVYIAGLGYYELRINGRKVGRSVLDPAWTTYEKRVLYAAYDVTGLLQPGPNALAVTLGQGWYTGRVLLLQLNVELEGGGRLEVVSDASWKVAQGPIVADSIYHGETYDASRETPGWDRPGYDDSKWKPASPAEAPKGVLSAQMMPPIRVVDTIVPLKMTSPKPGVYVYDMGQNFSGWVQLRLRARSRTTVRLRHAELLYDDGTLNVENLRQARATDTYVPRADGEEEIWEPRFTYHGFRYVEVTGFPGTPTLDSIRGKVVHTDVRPAGGFAASKAILNQIQRLILWGITSNLHSIPTDCNQRDERMGWMADAHLYAESAMLNYDAAAFYANFLRDIRDVQGADGSLTDTVPHRWGRRPADPAWGAAYPLIAWYLYLHHGDRRVLEEHFPGVKAWTDFQRAKSEDGILSYSYYGDWVPVEKTPNALVSTFYYYYCAHLTARMAEILGKTTDAEAYRKLAAGIQEAFNRKFWNADNGYYGNGSQTSQILPLYLDLATKERRGPAMGHLRSSIVYYNNTHLMTGILGTKYGMELLGRAGNLDLAYDLAVQTTYPSWGYMIERGATTLWELWQEKTGPSMNSHNHPMFGSVGAWYYSALAGINYDPEKPGYERIRIQPGAVRDLHWASGTLQTLRGTVLSSWSRTERSFRLEVIVPVGSEAEIHLPKLNLAGVVVKEGQHVVWKENAYQPGGPGLSAGRQTPASLILQAGSGHYVFELSGE